MALPAQLAELAQDIATLLIERKETVGVAESSAGGLISATLLSVPGASAYYLGGAVIYTGASRRLLEGNLTVRKRLLIKASGRVSGTIRYGQIEIECGGQISGDVQAQAIVEGETARPSLATTSSFLEAKAS